MERPATDPVRRIRLGEAPGVEVEVVDLGATITSLMVTGGDGVRRDVTLAHADPLAALESTDFLGSTVGRLANRVAGGRFELDGETVRLQTNEGRTTLHGGPDGFDKRRWEVESVEPSGATLRLVSADGDQGFPGELTARLEVRVGRDSLELDLEATADAPTPVAMTSHLYLCLGDDGVLDHELRVAADGVHLVDEESIPLPGPARPVGGTAYDLRGGRRVAEVVEATSGGLDHDFALRGAGLREVAWLTAPATRTRAVLSTDQPDLQVYTGQALRSHAAYAGLALEPQTVPDAVNRPDAPDVVLRPGATYRCRIRWRWETL